MSADRLAAASDEAAERSSSANGPADAAASFGVSGSEGMPTGGYDGSVHGRITGRPSVTSDPSHFLAAGGRSG